VWSKGELTVSKERFLASLVALTLGLASSPARAGFPGDENAKEFQHSLLRYVCSNQTQTQCPVDPSTADLITTQCPSSPTPSCIPDYVPNAEILALLTIIADDRTGDTPPANPSDPDVRTTAMLEFKVGSDSYAIADFFAEGTQIGDWFFVPTEKDVFHFDFSGGALLGSSLTNLRNKLLEIGRARLGVPASGVTPVMVEGLIPTTTQFGTPKPQELETDQSLTASGSNPGQPLASIARYRVTIKFVHTP
jgi:hypothetical protein